MNGGWVVESRRHRGSACCITIQNHLAIVDPNDPQRNQSEKVAYLSYDAANNPYELDNEGRVLQPWSISAPTANIRSSKMMDRATNIDERWGGIWNPELYCLNGDPSDEGYIPPEGATGWVGRNFGYSQSWNGSSDPLLLSDPIS